MKRTAVLIDGGFFFQRIMFFIRKYFRKDFSITAEQLARVIRKIVRLHIEDSRTATRELYRVYYYDCPPPSNQVRLPIASEGQTSADHLNFKSHPPYQLRRDLHDHLRSSRKTALRLGELAKTGEWQLNAHTLKDLLRGARQWAELTNGDFHYKVQQKAVDTKLGMDITTLTLDKLVDVVILVAGDSDFVPAAKLARMKGIDFILDPMWANTSRSLSEHVDGLRSYDLVKIIRDVTGEVVSNPPDWWEKCLGIGQQKVYAEMVIAGNLDSDPGVPN
ncbi:MULTISPECIES: NYN domain-containing protein [unclassified Pseudomonas]|uniref:NYN domain-containing protein n=1 Tax=unclassified Pseudomonas TaxID=196821 RepID=UPI00128C7F32|nr:MULTISPECIES: NYN domain-containing protein [unclassified Pseudomonas]MPQ65357.1 NYN domain-containing protein [Pseudomonas sp. MWU12-2323]